MRLCPRRRWPAAAAAAAAAMLLPAADTTAAARRTETDDRAAGTLDVVSEPPGAEVLVDRRPRGVTPLLLPLPPGDYLVTLRRHGYRPEHRQLTVAPGLRVPLRVEMEPLAGLLLAHSSPTNAEVLIDGAVQGRTPLLLTSLPLGRHRLRFSLPGYQPKEIEVELADRVPRRVAVDLTADSGTLVVTAEPEGAEVLVNGISRGEAPCRVERIPEGDATVEVRAPGHRTFRQEVRLAAGEILDVHARLEPLPATLRVVSIPDGARVYLDNEFRGETPLTIENIHEGEHRLRVEMAGFDPMARTLTLERGAARTEEFRLRGNTGRLRIVTTPPEVTVLVDGKQAGVTAAPPGEAAVVSAPLTIENIPEGEHTVMLTRPGYVPQTRKIAVQRDGLATLNVELERRFIPDYEVTTARDVYRGMLDSKTDEAIRLETAPGVIVTFPMRDVRHHRPLNGKPRP
jgi:archaellum component FlaG (FlaF/FlaG flagellin family)